MTIFKICKKILFIIFILILALNLACSKTSIEEDIEADIEEKYLSEIKIISSASGSSLKKLGQASSNLAEGKISISEHKAITKKYIEEIKALYDMHLELKSSKRLEKSNDFFGKGMDHLLKSTTFLQSYIDTDDIEKMTGYIRQSNAELDLSTEYILKAVEQRNKLTE